jgi:hypothetical protein
MTSQKKILANRLNAKRSTGPRTSQGKSRASSNAWRHGWAVGKTIAFAMSADVERMAKAICGDHASPALYEQAVTIAECEMVLLKLRAARVAAIRRHGIVGRELERRNRDPCFINELTFAMEALVGGELRPAIKLLNRQARALRAAVAQCKVGTTKIDPEGSSQAASLQSSLRLTTGRVRQQAGEVDPGPQPREEADALVYALPELVSLERYERRAMSRRRRAIRMFEAISTVAAFLDRETKGR